MMNNVTIFLSCKLFTRLVYLNRLKFRLFLDLQMILLPTNLPGDTDLGNQCQWKGSKLRQFQAVIIYNYI